MGKKKREWIFPPQCGGGRNPSGALGRILKTLADPARRGAEELHENRQGKRRSLSCLTTGLNPSFLYGVKQKGETIVKAAGG